MFNMPPELAKPEEYTERGGSVKSFVDIVCLGVDFLFCGELTARLHL
jgi:hypothetical protein